jgi:hypothetical protein
MLAEGMETVETWKIVASLFICMWPTESMVCRQEVESDRKTEREVVEIRLHRG